MGKCKVDIRYRDEYAKRSEGRYGAFLIHSRLRLQQAKEATNMQPFEAMLTGLGILTFIVIISHIVTLVFPNFFKTND